MTDEQAAPAGPEAVTAAILVIGDEILSGRTKDKNIGYIAEYLTAIGIDVKEVRVVGDEMDRIVEAVNALRTRYDYVFTTGGIGPTHDDITADAIAAAFGVGIGPHPEIVALMRRHYAETGLELNEARLRMARVPDGADIIENKISKAPGFRIGNVHVMAGVPTIMQAMLDAAAETLVTGRKMLSRSVEAHMGEGDVAKPLGELQDRYPDIGIGSYPYFDGKRFTTQIVLRGRDESRLDEATRAAETMLEELRISKADGGRP